MSAASHYANDFAQRSASWVPFHSEQRSFWARMMDRFLVWQERAITRHSLAQMSDHMLKDVGLGRAEIQREISKPFWVE